MKKVYVVMRLHANGSLEEVFSSEDLNSSKKELKELLNFYEGNIRYCIIEEYKLISKSVYE